MTPQDFVAKWKRVQLSERSASQQHFLNLCDLLGQPTPAEVDPNGTFYTFERGVSKTGGGKGWADVWRRRFFAWEYKGKHKNLDAAYQQLLRYREDLENPPILVVCDMDRFEVHTNFTNTIKTVYAFSLDELAAPENLAILRRVFTKPNELKPQQTPNDITEEMAKRFTKLAEGMRRRDIPVDRAAHFLMKLIFCMFAEDIHLLNDRLFAKILSGSRNAPAKLSQKLHALFEAMREGGDFGADTILHFNGGLFDDAEVIDLTPDEIEKLIGVNDCDWSNVEPSIFGTLFERILDPDKRSQIGAHYTGKEDILTLLEPVLMAPLRREWEQVKAKADKAFAKLQESVRADKPGSRQRNIFEKILTDFLDRLAQVKILDPACGSGNFLYMSIKLLLDLEKEVITYGSNHDFSRFPHVEPTQLLGIEINPYAQQLAHVAIWIGYLQWLTQNGFGASEPILKPFENIKHMDAIIDLSDPDNPKEPEWPEAEFIVGNPPFLGGKLLRNRLGDSYVDAVFKVWKGRVRPEADICCYWFEKARQQIDDGNLRRAGLLATQGIRGGANRESLARIQQSGNIFFAVSDRNWILDGANVHISMVGYDDGSENTRVLDDKTVVTINTNLTAAADIASARRLASNKGVGFMGDTKVGAFDIARDTAVAFLKAPLNPNQQPNSDVVIPWINGLDITRRYRDFWIIDFGVGTTEATAALYEAPFEYLGQHVKSFRATARSGNRTGVSWWLHQRPRPDMREAIKQLTRYLATPTVSKHRLFVWSDDVTLPDHQLIVVAYEEDYFFGVLHSRLHEIWGLTLGTRLETRPRYTPTTCFETFPFPNPTDAQREAIAEAAKELDTLRNNWLNPSEWTATEILEFPGSVDGPWARYVYDADERGIGTVRYPRLVPKDETAAAQLKKRTLTNLYNGRPTWLDLAHQKLDAAVFAAYGWNADMSDDEILEKLLELNLERAREETM